MTTFQAKSQSWVQIRLIGLFQVLSSCFIPANAQQLPIIVQPTTPTTCYLAEAFNMEQSPRLHYPLMQSFSQTLIQTQLSHPVLFFIPEPSSVFELNLLSQAIFMPPSSLLAAFEAPGSLVTQVSQAVSEPNSKLTRIRKLCAIHCCPEFIAPTMGRLHMTLLLQGLLTNPMISLH